jgi:hypothetical protein
MQVLRLAPLAQNDIQLFSQDDSIVTMESFLGWISNQ